MVEPGTNGMMDPAEVAAEGADWGMVFGAVGLYGNVLIPVLAVCRPSATGIAMLLLVNVLAGVVWAVVLQRVHTAKMMEEGTYEVRSTNCCAAYRRALLASASHAPRAGIANDCCCPSPEPRT